MPGALDGMDVLQRLRLRPHAPPVAILTAYASSANTIEAMRLGAFRAVSCLTESLVIPRTARW
jgi:DNA-binding response OmpR family regulator